MRGQMTSACIGMLVLFSSRDGADDTRVEAETSRVTARVQRNPDSLRIAHVLNRLTFGARPGDLERIAETGVDNWLDVQLQPTRITDRAAAEIMTLLPILRLPLFEAAPLIPLPGTIQIMSAETAGTSRAGMLVPDSSGTVALRTVFIRPRKGGEDQIAIARVAFAAWNEQQLSEVIVDFWHNHFSIFSGKMPSGVAILEFDRDVIRPRALGNFRDLLGAVARSPAMLFYLDNHLSGADSEHLTPGEWVEFQRSGVRPSTTSHGGLNENYARELLELHTLGVDGGYTQADVMAVARAFTGWSISRPSPSLAFVFEQDKHDAEAKYLLGRNLPSGRGAEDGEDVLDILASHPATARHIARKLAARLVSDEPPMELVERATEAYIATDGNIREVVRAIVTSKVFFSSDAFRSKVKTPFELIVSIRRAISETIDTSAVSAQLVSQLQQPLWGRETPDGWPETSAAWMSSGAMFGRVALAIRVANGDIPELSPDSSRYWRAVASFAFPKQLDAVVQTILSGVVSPGTLATLSSIGQPQRGARVPSSAQRLRDLIAVALSSPEFQKR